MAITKKTGFSGPFDRATKVLAGLILGGTHIPVDITFAIAAGAANVTNVTISVTNKDGLVIPGVHVLNVWLSDAATGVGLTTTSASGTVQAKANSGTINGALTAKKALQVATLATGVFVLEITDAAKTGFYVAANTGILPAQVSRQLVTADYGA